MEKRHQDVQPQAKGQVRTEGEGSQPSANQGETPQRNQAWWYFNFGLLSPRTVRKLNFCSLKPPGCTSSKLIQKPNIFRALSKGKLYCYYHFWVSLISTINKPGWESHMVQWLAHTCGHYTDIAMCPPVNKQPTWVHGVSPSILTGVFVRLPRTIPRWMGFNYRKFLLVANEIKQ